MCSAKLGDDPLTSVAKPNGELHDTSGVWIADASGMPSCSGVNPMVSTMALARRTGDEHARSVAVDLDQRRSCSYGSEAEAT
jgi:choline dehydrogenase-like flavoprotein